MRRRPRSPSKPVIFAALMVVAALLTFVPDRWIGCVRGVVQPLAFLQYGSAATAQGVNESAEALIEPGVPRARVRELASENERLRRQLGQQSVAIGELEQQVAEISAIRDQLRDGSTKLHFAPVIGFDASPRSETLLVGRGSRHHVDVGQWVVAGRAPGERAPEASGRELVARQWLIGRISEVYPYTSRVRLATDPAFGPVRVRAARVLRDATWQVAEDDCLLSGCGRGHMLIDRATADYYADGRRLVLVRPSGGLPSSLAIGEVVSARSIPDAPLHFDLEVRPLGDVRRLDWVYVIAPGS